MKHVGRLLRLSLAPSALADAAAGILVGAAAWPAGNAPFLLLAGSFGVYHGGMALNDWADRVEDGRVRGERPIPSGRIAPNVALALAAALLVGGVVSAWSASYPSGVVLLVVAALAVIYDVVGRGPWLGPLLLGACRAGNLYAGIALTRMATGFRVEADLAKGPRFLAEISDTWRFEGADLVLPIAYGAYVFVVSRLGRLEDGADRASERVLSPTALVRLVALLLVSPTVYALVGHAFGERAGGAALLATLGAAAIGAWGAAGLVRTARRGIAPTPAAIVPVMGMALRRLLVFTAQVALVSEAREAWYVAGLILLGYPLSHALRRLFPPS